MQLLGLHRQARCCIPMLETAGGGGKDDLECSSTQGKLQQLEEPVGMISIRDAAGRSTD